MDKLPSPAPPELCPICGSIDTIGGYCPHCKYQKEETTHGKQDYPALP